MTRILILNGPPRSGKDSLANHIVSLNPLWRHLKFASTLKQMTHRLYNIPEEYAKAYEKDKETPRPEFYGLSARQAYINVSEQYIKPTHGTDFFGQALATQIEKYLSSTIYHNFVISDGGFWDEILPLILKFHASAITVVYLSREGSNWSKDSRNYISQDKLDFYEVQTVAISNEGDKEEYLTRATKILLPEEV